MGGIASPVIARESLDNYASALTYGRNDLLRRQAENDLRAYCLMVAPDMEPAAHHNIQIKVLERVALGTIRRLIIAAPPGSAKALALDTPIPTPTGWTRMGDLRVGDQVFDEHGKPCNVTWVSPVWRDRPVYAVKTDCGDEIVADHDHEWMVRLCGKPRNGGKPLKIRKDKRTWNPFKLKETHELCRDRAKRPMISRAAALETMDLDLPIDPYLLGVWLGDGHSAGMRITSSESDIQWLRAEIHRLGYLTSDSSERTLFGVLGVRAKFVAMGLLHDPAHSTHGRKHVPVAYLRASRAQRLALLQGLIDTDGTVCKKRGCTTFCNTNLELAESAQELARSLGVKASLIEGRATLYGKDCGPVYRVSFYMSGSARMPRKAALTRDAERTPNTYIDVTPAGRADTVCIEVDSPSHLFLCGRSMTPTHNSTYGSKRFVSWYRGKFPAHNIIQACHTTPLAESFGREVRDTCMTDEHMATFPECKISQDGRARGDWRTTKGGTYYAAGIGKAVTGRRAMLAVIDDPVKDRQDADSPTIRDWTYEWYRSALRTRLLPGGRIVISTTRWHYDDLVGRILPENWNGQWGWVRSRTGELWFVLNFPQESEDEEQDIMRRPKGELLWPSFFTPDMMAQEKKEGTRNWNALHQQRPQEEEGSILLSSYWRKWPLSKPPICEYLLSAYDTAFEESEIADNDFSARTSWAIFDIFEQDWSEIGGPPQWLHKSMQRYHAILVEAWRERIGFPGLRKEAQSHYERFKPDKVMVEKKASGHSLIQELRRASVPVAGYDPKGRSKTERASAAAVAFEQGSVWYMDRTWAQDVITECSRFPSGAHNDYVDTVSMAVNYLRRMYHMRFKFEEDEESNRIHQLRQMAHEVHTGRYSGVMRHAN